MALDRTSSTTSSNATGHGEEDGLSRARPDNSESRPTEQTSDKVDKYKLDNESESGDDEEEAVADMAKSRPAPRAYSEEEERVILRKLDRKLVLFLALLYLLSFLDRSNIGNARIAGMDTALSLSSPQYSWLLTAFYITYISFEWMILLYRLVPPHIYISLCVLSWGVIASLQSLTTSFVHMLILRALLGVGEAAFSPGVPFYMTFFYRRSELAYRVGLQISAAPLASSFASSLAWLIVKLSEHGPVEPWRALFLFEGFPAIFVAVFAWFYIPDSPSTARYLTPRERKIATLRLRNDTAPSLSSHPTVASSTTLPSSFGQQTRGLQARELLRTIVDPKAYLTALMFFSVNVAFSSLPPFLPSVINDMNFSAITSQALSAPPYLVSFIFVLLISHLSDSHRDSRSLYLIAVSLLSALSYSSIALSGAYHDLLGSKASTILRYLAIYGAAAGFFAAVTLIITWTLNNQPTASGRGMGMTLLNLVGQCGPLVGVRLFPKSQAPYYVPGMTICAVFMLGVAALAAGLRGYLIWLNRKIEREVGWEMVGLHGGHGDEEAEGEDLMGRRKGKTMEEDEIFRYIL